MGLAVTPSGSKVSRSLLPLIPAGLLVQQVLPAPDRLTILTRPTSPTSDCPGCGQASERVHSRYLRTLADLPSHGRIVALRVRARRFRCDRTRSYPWGRR
jgi:transposase